MPGRKREADSEDDEERFESAEDSEEDVSPRPVIQPCPCRVACGILGHRLIVLGETKSETSIDIKE